MRVDVGRLDLLVAEPESQNGAVDPGPPQRALTPEERSIDQTAGSMPTAYDSRRARDRVGRSQPSPTPHNPGPGIALGWTARAGRTSSVPASQRTADLLYALGTEDACLLFVVECGWSADEWEQWVIDTVSAQVLLPT